MTGTRFIGTTTVIIGDTDEGEHIAATVVSDTEINFVMPGIPAGVYDLKVQTEDGFTNTITINN